ncbi:MAG: OadG family protein [Lachnospiraceae bacterium]|nr:OadG family protein [Lachnospiraceae bacterium]MDD7050306.1 OadG family protein [Lachnospiraceae bacterium]MDY4097982.1 OadG family protein [Lachnospiraceae bacterium]
MKKLLLVLGMITCMLGLTACNDEKDTLTENYGVTQEQALEYGQGLVETMNEIVLRGEMAQYESDKILYPALESFSSALEEIGDYQSVTENSSVEYGDGITIMMEIQGTLRNAQVEIILDKELMITSISANVIYSFGELMAKAGLNTLMGMGTVFVVLILICLLISCFSLIAKVQKKSGKKKEQAAQTADKVVEQIMEREEQSDDLELAAVIAAAIAAYEGAASSDGYVVRSIKRRNR